MTTRMAKLKRLQFTMLLFGIAILTAGAVWYTSKVVQDSTNRRVNAIVCVTRPYIEQGRARSLQAAKHDKDPAVRARARQAVDSADQFLAGLLLEPGDFNCKPLLASLLREQKRREKAEEARNNRP